MSQALFKDFCIDASDAELIGRFYAELLRLEFHRQQGADRYLTGPTSEHTIWINQVPEPHTAKNRAHLDVTLGAVEDAVGLGARVLDTLERWTVMADPEGGEFCVFVGDRAAGPAPIDLVIDSADSAAQATWWAAVLGAQPQVDPDHGFGWVEPIAGAPFSSISFVDVPEPKTVKNRLHLDLRTDDIGSLTAAGATVLQPKDDTLGWTVLADPEGNEFCAFTL